MTKFNNYLASIFMIMLIIQFIPMIIKNIKNQYEEITESKVKVGLLKIKDEIDEIGNYNKNLKEFFEDKHIKAIMLHIESPGGAAGSSHSLFNEILAHKKDNPKPVVVLTNNLCASGAYYIACASDYIVASPSAIIGSIGSYIASFKLKELAESWKIKYNIMHSGQYKTALNPFTDSTPEINEFLQKITDNVYDQFKTDIATYRKLSLDKASEWANGKVFTGKQALDLGLIDEIGSEYNAIKKIRELAMIEKDKKIDFVKATEPTLYSQLLSNTDPDDKLSFINIIIDKLYEKIAYSSNKIVIK